MSIEVTINAAATQNLERILDRGTDDSKKIKVGTFAMENHLQWLFKKEAQKEVQNAINDKSVLNKVIRDTEKEEQEEQEEAEQAEKEQEQEKKLEKKEQEQIKVITAEPIIEQPLPKQPKKEEDDLII